MLNQINQLIDFIFNKPVKVLNARQRRMRVNMTPEEIEYRENRKFERKRKFIIIHQHSPKPRKQFMTDRIVYIQKAGEDIAIKVSRTQHIILRRDGTWGFNDA